MSEAMRHPIFQQAVEHFDSRAGIVIEVPEWGGPDGPAVLHAEPLNLREKAQIFRGASADDLSVLVDVLILKARDGRGEPVFSRADKPLMLRRLDPDVVARVAERILSPAGDMEKN